MRPRLSHLLLLFTLTIFVHSLMVDAKKCKNIDEDAKEKGKKCGKKEHKRKGRFGRSKDRDSRKKSVAPFWRKGPPSTERITVREGDKVTLTCAIKGYPSPKFMWLRNGKKVTAETSDKIRVRRHRLTIQTVVVEDIGKYTCIAENNLGSLNFTFSLWILEHLMSESIEIVDRPENQTAHIGDTAIFLCRSNDYPVLNVQWTRRTNRSRIIEDITASTRRNDNAVLVIHNVTKADSGVYKCYIGNDQMHRELSATLTVIEENERLPFEPPCALHVRRQLLVDHKHGCRSRQPVETNYCMGTCGRSYYTPQLKENPQEGVYFNQTCRCCVGVMEGLRLAELDCSLGTKKTVLYPILSRCQCQDCHVEDKHQSTPAPTSTTPSTSKASTTSTSSTTSTTSSTTSASP